MRCEAVVRGASIPADPFAALGALDQTELLRCLLGDELENLVAKRFDAVTPALSHALLASLRCQEVVTTNYDDCYERAVVAQDPEADIAVMPWQKPEPGRPWLLKLHGDASEPDSVVLTRGQFIGYDSRWRPVGSVFQSLLMIRQLLVVGASLSDDNVLRLAHEVRALRQRHEIEGLLGHVVSLGQPPLRAQLWTGELEWVGLDGECEEEQARHLEIFLDAVAMHACQRSPYLLHPYYDDLLNGGTESDLAERARDLASRITAAVEGGRPAAGSGLAGAAHRARLLGCRRRGPAGRLSTAPGRHVRGRSGHQLSCPETCPPIAPCGTSPARPSLPVTPSPTQAPAARPTKVRRRRAPSPTNRRRSSGRRTSEHSSGTRGPRCPRARQGHRAPRHPDLGPGRRGERVRRHPQLGGPAVTDGRAGDPRPDRWTVRTVVERLETRGDPFRALLLPTGASADRVTESRPYA
jgi:hypothetical protein